MRIDHVNIVVSDMERSLAFYVGLLGMRITFEVDLEGQWIDTVTGIPGARARCVFCEPDAGGVRFELLEYGSPAGEVLAGHDRPVALGLRHVALEVDDLEGWYERLRAVGVKFISPPVTVPFGVAGTLRKRLCYLHAPDGVIVELADYVRADAPTVP